MVGDGLCHLDPPRHMMHRQLIASSFAPRAIAVMENRIRARAAQILDRACELRNIDFVKEVAVKFPVAVVLGDVLGFLSDDLERGAYWGDLFNRSHAIPLEDPEFGPMRQEAAWALDELYPRRRTR
jgi:cytochrome P450